MPCSQHNHTPWPTSGVHTFRIEACERVCGWCNTKSTSATNLRSHARKHLSNPKATALQNITIFSGKAGRKRVELVAQVLSKQQRIQPLNTKPGNSDSRDHAPDQVTPAFDRLESEHKDPRENVSNSLVTVTLHENYRPQARRIEVPNEISKHGPPTEPKDHSAKVAPESLSGAGQERTIVNYRDVRIEIDDLERSIRKCSDRLRIFAANLPTNCPPVHRYGVESFITWCSLSSSSMLGLHEYFEERYEDRYRETVSKFGMYRNLADLAQIQSTASTPSLGYHSTQHSENVEGDRSVKGKIATPVVDEVYGSPETFPRDTGYNRVDAERQTIDREHVETYRMEPFKHRQLPSIDTLLRDRQISAGEGPRAETSPLVQLRYDSTARSINMTRTGRISKAKKGLKVHTCGCGRSYTRIEHLRRHQKNHATEDALVCEYPGCGKPFYRADLLLRHQSHHNEGDSALYLRKASPGTDSMRAMPPHSSRSPPYQAQSSRDATSPAPPEMASPIHQSSSSHWLDLGSPTNVFDFFSEPLLDPPTPEHL